MNPEKMRTSYGKLLYLLQDAESDEIREILGFNVVAPIKTVYSMLFKTNGLAVWSYSFYLFLYLAQIVSYMCPVPLTFLFALSFIHTLASYPQLFLSLSCLSTLALYCSFLLNLLC